MTWPIPIDPARVDTRLVTFAKGPWFGGVPHTRVYCRPLTAAAPLAWIANGVVLQSQFGPTETPIVADWVWRGTTVQDGDTFTCRYLIRLLSEPVHNPFVRFEFESTGTVSGNAAWEESVQNLLPATDQVMPLVVNSFGVDLSSTCVKVDIREWAVASTTWPQAVLTTPF